MRSVSAAGAPALGSGKGLNRCPAPVDKRRMKVVILAGGLGTRLGAEGQLTPKPLVPIGGRPILWHIMKIYAHFGFTDFILCLGYKGEMIKRYFREYELLHSDFTIELGSGRTTPHSRHAEDNWRVT